jgi:hypothetical protein
LFEYSKIFEKKQKQPDLTIRTILCIFVWYEKKQERLDDLRGGGGDVGHGRLRPAGR